MIRRAIPLFHVTNMAQAVKFYCHGLGFQLEFEHRPEGVTTDPCYAGMSRDGVWIHLSSFSEDGVQGGVANLTVDNVDHLYAEFKARHVHVDTPVDHSWGRQMCVKDMDGNCLRFVA